MGTGQSRSCANPAKSAPERLQLRRELEWEGFGWLAPGIFLHPSAETSTLGEVLDRLGLRENVVLLRAHDLNALPGCSSTKLVADCWKLDLLASRYQALLARFEPAPRLLMRELSPRTAFIVQTLLIHAFRRVVLHDPRLPGSLMPVHWSGHAAYELCREIYHLTQCASREFLSSHLVEVGFRRPGREYLRRLGGLEQ